MAAYAHMGALWSVLAVQPASPPYMRVYMSHGHACAYTALRACVKCVREFVRLQVVRMTRQAFIDHNARVRLCSARTDVSALRAHLCVTDVAL